MCHGWLSVSHYFGVFVLYSFVFFFFKQKSAYEMRISDWSSDVCSSDLLDPRPRRHRDAELLDPDAADHRVRPAEPVASRDRLRAAERRSVGMADRKSVG